MADYSCVYTLTTSAGTIRFNDGTFGRGSLTDLYWIDTMHGLDGPTLRFTADDVPFGDGGMAHRTFKGPRHPAPEGRLIVQSVGPSQCQAVLNTMEKNLRAALEACLAPSTGTLAWTPAGDSPHSLTVVYEREVEFQPADDYRTRSFDFGLFSASADI